MATALSSCSAPDRALPPAYRDVEVPRERLATPAARARGRLLFVEHCALCHGERADGRGVRSLSRPPRDLTDRAWQAQTTPRRLYFRLREGVPGTPMPGWRTLPESDCWDLVAYLRSLGEGGG